MTHKEKVHVVNYRHVWYTHWPSWTLAVYGSMSKAQDSLIKHFYEAHEYTDTALKEKIESTYSKRMKKYRESEKHHWIEIRVLEISKTSIRYDYIMVRIETFTVL